MFDGRAMSMKRSKQTSSSGSRGRDDDSDSPFSSSKPKEPEKVWGEQMAGKADDAFLPYTMTSTFEKGALVLHSKFGKGLVLSVEGARIEVLFEDGPKKLGHVA